MPLHYGSQIKEHEIVRKSCGIFDISHMTIIDIDGEDAKEFLKLVLSNDISFLKQNYDSMYTCFLNESGGIIDDLIAYKMPIGFRLVVNCATRKYDLKWLHKHSENKTVKIVERKDLSMLAIQGPKTYKILGECFTEQFSDSLEEKKSFQGALAGESLITKTGYTGEKGIEIMMSSLEARTLWSKAIASGARPIGLGARDTLRLEAGFNLYGSEMDEFTSPLECNMEWVISLKDETRDFIGKQSFLEKKMKKDLSSLKGLVFEERSIVRSLQEVYFDNKKEVKGIVTSGSYSPTLKKSIALARIPPSNATTCLAEVRGKILRANIGQPRFVKEGKVIF